MPVEGEEDCEMNNFKMKTDLRFGEGALDTLKEFPGRNVVIFTDPFMVKSGAAAHIAQQLEGCASVEIFGEVRPDPPIELIVDGLKFLLSKNADVVVALGGGSSIDAAKSVVYMAKQTGKLKKVTFVAIPTTSGTGSEVTKFAVITDTKRGAKYPLVDEELMPDIAILDAHLVSSAPQTITADTGCDVITHALEAYVSANANDVSDALAEKALELAFIYLPRAYRNGRNEVAREKMHTASCLAGMAFNAVSLGVNHSIAHALGAKFHIPHGRANAMLLPHVVEFNANLSGNFGATDESTASKKYARIAKLIGLPTPNTHTGVANLVEELKYLLRMLKIPVTLAEAGVDREEYEKLKPDIIQSALKDVCSLTNPRPLSEADVDSILKNLES